MRLMPRRGVRIVTGVGLISALLLLSMSGIAQGDVSVGGETGGIAVTGSQWGVETGAQPIAGRPVSAPGPVDPTAGAVLVPEVQLDPAGNRCVYVTAVSGDPNGAAAASGEASLQRLLLSMPFCPNSPVKAVPPASPLAAAEYAWRRDVPLPVPKPNIDPGYAVTGKPAYMETGSTTQFGPVQVTELGYDITITAVGTFEVRWGDGSVTGPGETSAGGKWPNGDVTHVFDVAGAYQVQVIETWTGHYVINGQAGDIPDPITTEGGLPDFPARQVQAVLNT